MKNKKSFTLEEVKNIMLQHYDNDGATDRELIIWKPKPDKDADCYFFALEGTPPKGYAIYVNTTERHFLCLYNSHGERYDEYYLDKGIKDLE